MPSLLARRALRGMALSTATTESRSRAGLRVELVEYLNASAIEAPVDQEGGYHGKPVCR